MASDNTHTIDQKIDKVVEQMFEDCIFIRTGQTREECCKEKGIINCPPEEPKENIILPIAISVIFLLIFAFILFITIKNKWIVKLWTNLNETSKAVVSGSAIWWLIVLSYVMTIEPYGSRMHSDDYINLLFWLILPPLCVFLLYVWIRRFIWKKH